ncbi:MAG: type VI secretion system protein TssA, partial [Planctomycetales bacterium]
MSIDVEKYLQPISEELPCGENLEYEPAFQEMEEASKGKEAGGIVEAGQEAEPPEWKEVKAKSLGLLETTRDLRPAVYLARSVLNLDGWRDFADALAMIQGFLEKFWDQVWPELDHDDPSDLAGFRVYALQELCGAEATLYWVERTPLIRSRMVGQFSLRDVKIANGDVEAPSSMDSPPTTPAIEAAFRDEEIETETIQGTLEAINDAIEHTKGIEAGVTAHIDATMSVRLTDLVKMLEECAAYIQERLQERVPIEEEGGESGEGGSGSGSGSGPGGGDALSGRINSRTDVLKALDMVNDYYTRHEPSSPLALVVRSA